GVAMTREGNKIDRGRRYRLSCQLSVTATRLVCCPYAAIGVATAVRLIRPRRRSGADPLHFLGPDAPRTHVALVQCPAVGGPALRIQASAFRWYLPSSRRATTPRCT